MPDVLITGGAGFIGSHLTHRLADNGYEVRVFDNLFRANEDNLATIKGRPDVEFVRGDIQNYRAVSDAMEDVDSVVHLAAVCLNRSIDYPARALEVNLLGTNTVLQAAADHDIDRVLAASSASVYGNQPIPMAEDDKPRPQTPYGISKLGLEFLLDFYAEHHGIDYAAYRFFNVYGPGQPTDAYYTSVINVFVENLLAGDAPTIHGSGEQTMDFVHVEDVARALELGLEADVEKEIFNVGSGEMTSISELAELLIDIVGADVEPKYVDRDVVVSERKASTSHAKERLGFETEIPLDEGLAEVVEWITNDRSTPPHQPTSQK